MQSLISWLFLLWASAAAGASFFHVRNPAVHPRTRFNNAVILLGFAAGRSACWCEGAGDETATALRSSLRRRRHELHSAALVRIPARLRWLVFPPSLVLTVVEDVLRTRATTLWHEHCRPGVRS